MSPWQGWNAFPARCQRFHNHALHRYGLCPSDEARVFADDDQPCAAVT